MLKYIKLAILLATVGIVFAGKRENGNRQTIGSSFSSSSGSPFSSSSGSPFSSSSGSPFSSWSGSSFSPSFGSPIRPLFGSQFRPSFGSSFPNFPSSPYNSGYQKKTSGYNIAQHFPNDSIGMDELIESIGNMLHDSNENELGNSPSKSTKKIRLCCDDNEELTNCIELREGEICDRILVEREDSIFAPKPNVEVFSWTEKIEGGRGKPTESFVSEKQNYNEPRQPWDFRDPRSFSSSPSYDYPEIKKPSGLFGDMWNSHPLSTGLFFRNFSDQLPTDNPKKPPIPYYNNNKQPDNAYQQPDNAYQQPSFQTSNDIRKPAEPKQNQYPRSPRRFSYENESPPKENQRSPPWYGIKPHTPATKPTPYFQPVYSWDTNPYEPTYGSPSRRPKKEYKPIDQEEFRREAHKRHNFYRDKHGVQRFVMIDQLNQSALNYAKILAKNSKGLVHSDDSKRPGKCGENLAWYSNRTKNMGLKVADDWWCELEYCKPNDSVQQTIGRMCNIGHAIQMLWIETIYIGCGFAKAMRGDYYVVCHYYPGGNNIGPEKFKANVPIPFKQNDIDDARRLSTHFTVNSQSKTFYGIPSNSEEMEFDYDNEDIEKLFRRLKMNK